MYIWNTEALATELKQEPVSQREQFKYVFLMMFFIVVCDILSQAGLADSEIVLPTIWNVVIAVSYNSIVLVALYLCYRVNQTGDDQDFIVRFICLLIPLNFRAIIVFIIFYAIILNIVAFPYEEFPGNATDWASVGAGIFSMIWVYWRLLYWFRWIAHGTAPQEQQ